MKLLRNLSLGTALGALTVAGGLLGAATTANAQGAPPGFFQIPGTTTALLITGQVGTRGVYDANDAAVDYPALMPISSDILIPLFIPSTGNVNQNGNNAKGGFHFTAKDFSFGFITATPTAWGEMEHRDDHRRRQQPERSGRLRPGVPKCRRGRRVRHVGPLDGRHEWLLDWR